MQDDRNAAAARWRSELAAWRISDAILAAAPESPYRLPPDLFAAPDDDGDRRPHVLARQALPPGGVVLDVGCGAGAGSVPLSPPAGRLLGVDRSPEMLRAFEDAAARRGVAATTYEGAWPDVAAAVEPADVVVCHHVFYNVPDLAPFARALHDHARRRVVVELTLVHPWVPIGPLWRHFHGEPRPTGPSAELARAVLAEAGIDAALEVVPDRPRPTVPFERRVEHMRRRLCLPADRDEEVADALRRHGDDRSGDVAVLWWDVS